MFGGKQNMKKQVCVFLADGFEEIEGLTVVDLLRRAGIEVTTVSITESKTIHGAHGIDVLADKLFEEADFEVQDMFVLPGGMPGTLNLGAHAGVKEELAKAFAAGKFIAAICAAPSVLGKYGFLIGKKATSYPGFEDKLVGSDRVSDAVVVDGNVITSRGMGTAIPFSLALIEQLLNAKTADKIGKAIIYG